MLMDQSIKSAQRHGEYASIYFDVLTSVRNIDQVVTLAKQSHLESRFSYIPFSSEKVQAIAKRAIADPKRHVVLTAQRDGDLVGFVYCSIGEYHIGADVLLTTIHNINVLRSTRHTLNGGKVAIGLLRGVENWSRARSSVEILFHVTSGVDLGRTHKFIKRSGYRFIGGSYAKRVN